mgnify:FL=1
MSCISSKNSKPEIAVRSLLHRAGYRFSLHRNNLPGKPDICLPKYNTVIFVHGCYWHRHEGCKKGRSLPATNKSFWKEKFAKTVKRDIKSKIELEKLGWNVLTIWECEIKNKETLEETLLKGLKGIIT